MLTPVADRNEGSLPLYVLSLWLLRLSESVPIKRRPMFDKRVRIGVNEQLSTMITPSHLVIDSP